MDKILSLENVTKKYNKNVVLKNINLIFNKNEATAIIGPNGTGKSTLLKIIAGVLTIDKGKRVSYLSRNLKINYVPERFPKLRMTPREYLYYMGRIQNVKKNNLKSLIEKYLDDFYVSENMRKTWISQLSKGSIQKISVIQALTTKPDILLLDEPISGQDIKSQDNFIKVIKKLKIEGVLVIFSCHEEYLIEKLADRIISINDNKIVSDIAGYNNSKIVNNEKLSLELTYDTQVWKNTFYDIVVIRPTNKSTMQYIREFEGVLKVDKNESFFIIYVNRNLKNNLLTKIFNLNEEIISINPSVINELKTMKK